MARSLNAPIDARWLARAGTAPGCATGQLPVDFDRLLAGTDFDARMGQSPAAFAAGRLFEDNAAGPNRSYAPLIAALAEAGLDIGSGGIESFATGDDSHRAERTRKRVTKMLRGDTSVVLIAQAVIEFAFAGRTALIRPDAVVIVPIAGRLVVVELKGFRLRDGHYPADKIAKALEQTAVYQLALRRLVADIGSDPDLVSPQAIIVCAARRGLQPVATTHENGDRARTLELRIARAETQLLAMGSPDTILVGLDTESEPDERLAAFEALIAAFGTDYRPGCLATCGGAQYCREAAHDDPARLGATRLVSRAGSISRAVELAHGATPDPAQAAVAARLAQARQTLDAARVDAGLTPVPAPARRRRVS